VCAGAVVLAAPDPRSPGITLLSIGVAFAALLALAGAMAFAQPGWIGPALGSLGTVFVAQLLFSGTTEITAAAGSGIALLAAGELAQWSIDTRHGGRYERRVHGSRARGIGTLLLAGLATILVAGMAAALPMSGGVELMVVATAAALTLFGLTAFTTRAVSR
jgi:hypothetical protein